ncbi:hypothetical protein V6Z11_A05G448500 [Gossypium hirsutum]
MIKIPAFNPKTFSKGLRREMITPCSLSCLSSPHVQSPFIYIYLLLLLLSSIYKFSINTVSQNIIIFYKHFHWNISYILSNQYLHQGFTSRVYKCSVLLHMKTQQSI